jgi:hypothetical protein
MIVNYHAKANKKVWEALGFRPRDRYQCQDGNYILWRRDLDKLGSMLGMTMGNSIPQYYHDVCAQIGAVLLTLPEAAEEQRGEVVRTLPRALAARFDVGGEYPEGYQQEAEDTAEENQSSDEETKEEVAEGSAEKDVENEAAAEEGKEDNV